MKRALGIGGIFFKAENPEKLARWYERHLGLSIDKSFNGYTFDWKSEKHRPEKGYTLWSPFKSDTDYIKPSSKDFMINFIVDDLEQLLKVLAAEGVEQVDEMQDTEFGKFGWVLDPEGHKVELWEPAEE